MSREIDCKWYFGVETGRDDGPNDAMAQNFRDEAPWASLIRESIQNSLDAVYDGSQPVRVEFLFKELSRASFPNFFELEDHIQGCLDYYPQNQNAQKKFTPMLKFFEEGRENEEKKLGYIKVSDFNTRGMNYVEDATDSPFYAFVQAAGVTVKSDSASGGSYGFGKAAYFNISPISTILVSTRTVGNKQFFEGVSALCTHKCNNVKYTSVGFYSNNEREPISKNDEIPVPFRRTEPGTDVLIMGIEQAGETDFTEMIEAVIRNFWLAIQSNKLEVKIGDYEINRDSLESLMGTYFPEAHDKTKNYSENYNPKPYYETVVKAGTNKSFGLFEEKIPILGNVKLYIQRSKTADDMISYFRQQRMLIFKKKKGTSFGFYAVFVCDDRDGNAILQSMEPPAHNRWVAKNSSDVAQARSAMNEIDNFIDRCLDSFFDLESTTSLSITDLEDYLYNEDLSETDSEESASSNPFMGNPTGDFIPEGGSINTEIEKDPKELDTATNDKGTVIITQPGTAENGGKGGKPAGTGHRNKKVKTKGGKPAPGNNFGESEIDEDGGGAYKTFVDVEYRIVAQKENGVQYHYIIIHSDEEIENGEVNLLVGSESRDVPINIVETSEGEIVPGETKGVENVISGIALREGKNTLKLRFDDNLRHSIILKTYKVKGGNEK